MEQPAACVMNIRSESLSARACGAGGFSLRSCSPPTPGGQAACQLRFSHPLSFQSVGSEFNGSTEFYTSVGALPKRPGSRSLQYKASFSRASTGGRDVPLGSCFEQVRILHSGSDHNHRPPGRPDSRVAVDGPARGVLDRQAAGLRNAVVLVDQGRRSSKPFVLTADDIPRHLSSFERNHLDIASQKSLVLPEKTSDASKQLCVAVDVDEVLGSFLTTLNLFIEETYSVHHDISEYYIYDFMKIWNCSQVEANLRVHAFFDSEHFKNGISPIPGAHQTLLQLASYCQFVVVTSRQHVIRDRTLEWINRYYAGIFKEVHFGNHFALEGTSRRKSEICRSLGAHVLIDDNPRYAIDCAESGIEVLLFDLHGGYPWSKTPCGPQHPLITRVKNWQEVEQALLARTCAEL